MRRIKSIVAIFTSAIFASCINVSVSAMKYDMNTPQYKIITQALTEDHPESELLMEFFNRKIDKGAEYNDKGEPVIIAHHVYGGKVENFDGEDLIVSGVWVDFGPTDKYEAEHGKSRTLVDENIHWNWYICKDKSYTQKEIEDIIARNGLEVSLESIDDTNYNFSYPDNVTLESVLKTYYILNDELDMNVQCSTSDTMIRVMLEATLKGDANLDDIVDLADITTLAKYNLSNSSYPLENETAYANADMNSDGVVDGLDTSALIENQLGK